MDSKSLPKFARLAQQIKSDIALGRLGPGDQVPSFAALRRTFGATPSTVERVIASLERDGLVERRHRKGIFVRVSQPQAAVTRGASYLLMRKSVAVINLALAQALPETMVAPGWAHFTLVGILDALRRHSLNALAINDFSSPDRVASEIIAASPCGLILPELGPYEPTVKIAREVASAGIPVVTSREDGDLGVMDQVVSDFESGTYELTKWLINRGRRRIINLWPAIDHAFWYPQRLAGYRRAMTEAGLEPLPTILLPLQTEPLSKEAIDHEVRTMAGYMAEYLIGSGSIDAISAVTDGSCDSIGAMLRLFHKEPNMDVDIVGYDNYWRETESSHLPRVLPLATVDKQNHLLGEALVQLLKDRCDGKLSNSPVKRMTPQLVVEIHTQNSI